MKRLADRAAIVTGAASGIGRATALRLADEGATVLCLDVQADAVAEVANDCGTRARSRVCDVSDPGACREAVASALEAFGRLDVLCNVAGILRFAHTHELALADWRRMLDVNLTGTFLMCQAALPHLLERQGCIINTASTSALAGLPWGAGYGASKAGILGLTSALAVEYGKRGLRANAVCPGSIKTPITKTPMPADIDPSLVQRLMPLDTPRGPEAVAGVIAMLASSDGAHINGEHIRIDGGTLA